MRDWLLHILRGRFLIAEDAFQNWKMLFYLFVLAIIMIASSHIAEKKVHQIAVRNTEVRALRSEFVESRAMLMQLKMQSVIVRKMASKGIKRSEKPPKKIIVNNK